MTIPNEDPRITNPENPDSLGHWEIYRAFHPQDATDAYNAAHKYVQMATDWEMNVQQFAARIHRSSAAAWDGAAAEASRQAINNYAQRALDFGPPLRQLATEVNNTVTGIVNTKNVVAEPIDSVAVWDPHGWDFGVWEGSKAQDKIESGCDDARDAMKNYYVTDFTAADKKIPVLPQPVSVTDPLYTIDPNQGPGPTGTGIDNSGGTQPGGIDPSGGTNDGGDSQSGQPTESGQESPEDGQNSTTTAGASASNPPTGAATPTTPSAMDPNSTSGASTRPSGVGPSAHPGGGLGGLPGGGGLGGGLGGGPGGSSRSGGPGHSVPGTPGTGAGTTGTPAAAATRGATPGRAGMPGMGAMGRGGGQSQEDDESDHELPDWLRNMDNTEELLGPAPRTIPGGVIGGDYTDPPAEK